MEGVCAIALSLKLRKIQQQTANRRFRPHLNRGLLGRMQFATVNKINGYGDGDYVAYLGRCLNSTKYSVFIIVVVIILTFSQLLCTTRQEDGDGGDERGDRKQQQQQQQR